MYRFVFFCGLVVIASAPLFAAEVVSELPNAKCEKKDLKRPLQVYVDPALYASNPRLMVIDPVSGLATPHPQDPRLSLFTGTFYMKQISPEQHYPGFRTVARMYGFQDSLGAGSHDRGSRSAKRGAASNKQDMAIRIQICGDDAYAGTPGLVFLKDLQEAQKDDQQNQGMPPSVDTIPNPNDYPPSRNM